MLSILMSMLFYLIPIAAIVFFVISLCAFLIARQKNGRNPNTYSAEQMKIRKYMLIVSSIIMGTFLLVVLSFVTLMFMAAAFM